MEEQIKSILGRELSYYNGFNASSEYLYIKQVEKVANGFILSDGNENGRSIHVSEECFVELINVGIFIKTEVIDHCFFRDRWSIK